MPNATLKRVLGYKTIFGLCAVLTMTTFTNASTISSSPLAAFTQTQSVTKAQYNSRNSGQYLPRRCERVYDRMLENEFETLLYIASYRDLVRAFGRDVQRAREHYVKHGCKEGRRIVFDPIQYIAGYNDLVKAFGQNERAGLEHYFNHGLREGRQVDRFCGRAYASAFGDLRRAFGRNEFLLAKHYIQHGFRERRGRKAKFQFKC